MPNPNTLSLALLLAGGFLALPACTLPPPSGGTTTVTNTGTGTCNADLDGGVDAEATDGGYATSNIDNVVTPVSCNATNSAAALALFKYAPGYTPNPAVQQKVQQTLNEMSLTQEATQMRGTPYGNAYTTQMTDVERSLDVVSGGLSIRGFRYRDASRGMNLAEDMNGTLPNAGYAPGSKTPVGYSTAFPVSMARGAAFDLDLEYAIGEAIGDEMQAAGQTLLLAPCMNLLRNPLWGRAQETYGEDSFHIGRLASAMTVGIQQHIAANAKHYMAYDIEDKRAENNSQLDEQTLREIYARHFRMAVQDGGVASVMASYNLVNSTKSTQNHHTLTDVMRTDFGFQGFILSDWWAMPGANNVSDASTLKGVAVQAVNAGLDVELPWALNYGQLENIVQAGGGITKAQVDAAAGRILEQKFRFNADPMTGQVGLGTPTTQYVNSQILCNAQHVALAQRAAVESMVLLKNDNNTLPINPSVTKVAVISASKLPYATTNNGQSSQTTVTYSTDVVTGDMGSSRVFFNPKDGIGAAQGIQDAAPSGVQVVTGSSANDVGDAQFVVVMAGLTPGDEGEEYTLAGDRTTFALDAKLCTSKQYASYCNTQNNLISSVAALGKPMAVVLIGGSVIDVSSWLDNVPALVMAWYPGEHGGEALGQLLWGQANFGGKLPFTWDNNFEDYGTFNGNGTTIFDYYAGYRYFDHYNKTPTFEFGHGQSYTTFAYSNLQLGCSDMSQGAVLPVVFNLANTGGVAGDEIAMVFVSFPNTQARRGPKELKGFQRVHLEANEAKQITIPLRLKDLDYFQTDASTLSNPNPTTGKWVVESGTVNIMVGGSYTNLPLTGTVNVNGY